MNLSFLGRWEWLLLELLLLAFLIYELISVNRLIRRDREAKPKDEAQPPEN